MENHLLNEIHITGDGAAVLAIAEKLESRFPDLQVVMSEANHYAIQLNAFRAELAYKEATAILAAKKESALKSSSGSNWICQMAGDPAHSVDIYIRRDSLDLSGRVSDWVGLSHVFRGWLDGVPTNYRDNLTKKLNALVNGVFDIDGGSVDLIKASNIVTQEFLKGVDGILLPTKELPYCALILVLLDKIAGCQGSEKKYEAASKVLRSLLEVYNGQETIEGYAESLTSSWDAGVCDKGEVLAKSPSSNPPVFPPLVSATSILNISSPEFIDYGRWLVAKSSDPLAGFERLVSVGLLVHLQLGEFARFWEDVKGVASKIDEPDELIVAIANMATNRPISGIPIKTS